MALTLSMSDGSVATLAFVASGDRALGKERYEVFGGGRPHTARARLSQDKGHRGEGEAIRRVRNEGGPPPISLESMDSIIWVNQMDTATRKTTVEIDEQLLQRVRGALGTTTLRETVDKACRAVLRERARREEVEALSTMRGMDLNDDRDMAAAWRP